MEIFEFRVPKEWGWDPFTPVRITEIDGIVVQEFKWAEGEFVVFVGDQSTHLSYDEVVYNLTERPPSFHERIPSS